MKIVYSILFFLSTIFTCASVNGQEHVAPTLQIGLNGFDYSKGTLDHELILEIIAEKQEEVKERLVKFMFLNKLDSSGATIYGYVDNTIDILRNSKDHQIRTRSIIENSVNLAIIASFTEYFLLKYKSSPNVVSAYNTFNGGTAFIDPLKNAEMIEDFDFIGQGAEDDTWWRGDAFEKRNKHLADFSKNRNFMAFFIDMAALEIDNSQEFKRLGIYRNSYVNMYDKLNAYDIYRNKVGSGIANSLRQEMRKELSTIMSYAGLLAYLDNLNHVHIGEISDLASVLTGNKLTNPELKTKLDDLFTHLETGLQGVANGSIGLGELEETALDLKQVARQDLEWYQERIKVLNAFVYRIHLIDLTTVTDPNILGDLLYEIVEKVIPATNDLLAHEPKMLDFAKDVSVISQHVLASISAAMAKRELSNTFFSTSFATIIAKLYQFDEAETYEQYFTILTDVAKMFKDERIYSVVQTITSFTNTHMKFVKGENDEELIEFDVEGILSAIQQKSYNKHRPLQFSFTVGTSTAHFSKPFVTGEEALSNMAFVSEKIGLKFKLFDWRYRYSFNKGETFKYYGRYYKRLMPKVDPIVDNIHLTLYGSGLLYNITNLTSERSFEYPIYGGGLGVTFFNSLDFNFSVAKPIIFNSLDQEINGDVLMYNIGFDIQFLEYSRRLNEKRKEQKRQKELRELKKIELQN